MHPARGLGILLGFAAAIVLSIMFLPDAVDIAPTGRALGRVAAFAALHPLAAESPRTVRSYINASDDLDFESVEALGQGLAGSIAAEPSLRDAVRRFDVVSVRRNGVELSKLQVLEVDPVLSGVPTLVQDMEPGLQDCIAAVDPKTGEPRQRCLTITGHHEIGGFEVTGLRSDFGAALHWRQDNLFLTLHGRSDDALIGVARELIRSNTLSGLVDASASANPSNPSSASSDPSPPLPSASMSRGPEPSVTPVPSGTTAASPEPSITLLPPTPTSTPSPMPSNSSRPSGDASQSPDDGATEADVAVAIEDSGFRAVTVTIRPGDTILWTNRSDRTHTVTLDSGPTGFDSGPMGRDDTFVVRLEIPGTYKYSSQSDPAMVATIIVLSPIGESIGPSAEASLPNVAMKRVPESSRQTLLVALCAALLVSGATLLMLRRRPG